MVTMLKMLGLPVMGYVSPDVNGKNPDGTDTHGVTNGGEPKGYVLGTQCVKISDTACVPWDSCGYETYSSLYAMSSSCCCEARNFRTHSLGYTTPIMGCNVQGETYYADGRSTVAADYDCNYKVNEANMPYIAGELFDHGTVNHNVLPIAHFCCSIESCWSEIAPGCMDQYLSSKEACYITKAWQCVCTEATPTLGFHQYGLVSCAAIFQGHPIDDTSSSCQGFLRIARLCGVTAVTDNDAIIGYNRRSESGATAASISEITPNDGEYLAKFYADTDNFYITHLFEYNASANDLGSNRLSDAVDNADQIIICKSATKNIYTNNQNPIAYRMYVSSDLSTKGVFVIMPLSETASTATVTCIESTCTLQKSFANHMDINPSTCQIELLIADITGYTCPYPSASNIDHCAVGTLGTTICIGKVAINCEYIPSIASNMLRVGHWDICDKISSTSEAQARLGTAETTNNNSGG